MANQMWDLFGELRDSRLYEELMSEFISNAGIEVEYLPRSSLQVDRVLNEPLSTQYASTVKLDVYIESENAFVPSNQVLGLAGLMWAGGNVVVHVGRKQFIGATDLNEPAPGDLLYVQQARQMFEVQNVNVEDALVSGGRLWTFVLYLTPLKDGENSAKFARDMTTGSLVDALAPIEDDLEIISRQTDQSLGKREHWDASCTDVTLDNDARFVPQPWLEFTMDDDHVAGYMTPEELYEEDFESDNIEGVSESSVLVKNAQTNPFGFE